MAFHHFHNGISPPDHININILTKMKTKVFFPGNDIIDFSLAIFTWYFGVVRDLRVSQMYNSGLIMVYF